MGRRAVTFARTPKKLVPGEDDDDHSYSYLSSVALERSRRTLQLEALEQFGMLGRRLLTLCAHFRVIGGNLVSRWCKQQSRRARMFDELLEKWPSPKQQWFEKGAVGERRRKRLRGS